MSKDILVREGKRKMKKGNLSWWLERENRKNLGKERKDIWKGRRRKVSNRIRRKEEKFCRFIEENR